MENINQAIRHLRDLWDAGEVQNVVALAYGAEGVSAGIYGRYDRDVATNLWRKVTSLESRANRDAGRDQKPLDFRSISADEYREIRARARRHRPHRDGVISELSARGLRGRLTGIAVLHRVRGVWEYATAGDTPEAPQVLRELAEALDRIATTKTGRRRQLIWLRPRGEGARRLVRESSSLAGLFAD